MIIFNIIFVIWAGYELINSDLTGLGRFLVGLTFSINLAAVLINFGRNL